MPFLRIAYVTISETGAKVRNIYHSCKKNAENVAQLRNIPYICTQNRLTKIQGTMKKVLLFSMLLMATMTATAQEIELNEQGAYERKEVVQVEGATAATLYDRAMIALSEWTGPDGKAKAGVDYQNQETHTIIYKGTYYLGFKRILTSGFDRYANFTLKVRCKDGRAQVTVNVPTITAIYLQNGSQKTYNIKEVLDVKEKSGKKRADRIETLVENLRTNADALIAAMTAKLKGGGTTDDDDF